MTFSFIDHRTLTTEDIADFEQLIAARNEFEGRPPRSEPLEGEWVLAIYITATAPDGQRLETEGVFTRCAPWQLTVDGDTHTEFVLMQFTAEGKALPDGGHDAPAASPPHRPAAGPVPRQAPPSAPRR
ncbi:hypothetical protein [Streptomyces sp. NPDC102462]|uniref:hypothetical protein n=1 Tax=Streptomyces sp. NPDC102462 TaxID=3366178 RepID=UPI0038212C02